MKKYVVFFLSVFLFFGFCLSSSVIAGEGDATDSSPGFNPDMSGAGKAIVRGLEAAADQGGDVGQALGGMAGLEPGVPVTIQFHVPVSISNLPSEITRTGVRCLVRLSRSNKTQSVFGPARNGGRTVLLSIPVSVPFNDAINNTIHGSYECRLLIQAGSETPVSLSDIGKTIEFDGSRQIVTVRGSF